MIHEEEENEEMETEKKDDRRYLQGSECQGSWS